MVMITWYYCRCGCRSQIPYDYCVDTGQEGHRGAKLESTESMVKSPYPVVIHIYVNPYFVDPSAICSSSLPRVVVVCFLSFLLLALCSCLFPFFPFFPPLPPSSNWPYWWISRCLCDRSGLVCVCFVVWHFWRVGPAVQQRLILQIGCSRWSRLPEQ